MIRDPSDGSVKEKHGSTSVDEQPSFDSAAALNDLVSNDILRSTTSGLPALPAKSDELIRLEKSREWLKLYSLKSGFSPSTM